MAKKRTSRKKRSPARDHYQEITDRILKALESGDGAPWQRPWEVSPYGSAPRNPVSGTVYRGINVMLTMMTQWERGYGMPLWLTFKQANEVAGKAARKAGHKVEQNRRKVWVYADGPDKGKSCGGIKAGQNKENDAGATTVIFWASGTRKEEDKNGEEKSRSWMTLKSYSVFNIEQCDDAVRELVCPPDAVAPEFQPLDACEGICDGFDIETRHGGDRACYSPTDDRIQMPNRVSFDTPEAYYTTRFHEMGHATGHASRLDRPGIADFDYRGSHQYAEEELVAEFTACFLAGEAGIVRTVEGNSEGYLRHWASKLREPGNNRMVINAAQRAQKAADLILGRQATRAAKTEGDTQEVSQVA